MILAGIFIKPMILIAARLATSSPSSATGSVRCLVVPTSSEAYLRSSTGLLTSSRNLLTGCTPSRTSRSLRLDGLKVVIEAVLKPLGEFIETIKKATYNVLKPFGDAVSKVFGAIFGFASGTGGPMEKIKSAFGGFGSGFLENMTKLADAIGPKWSEKVKDFLGFELSQSARPSESTLAVPSRALVRGSRSSGMMHRLSWQKPGLNPLSG